VPRDRPSGDSVGKSPCGEGHANAGPGPSAIWAASSGCPRLPGVARRALVRPGLIVCFVTFGMYSNVRPYEEARANVLASACQVQIFFALLSAIALSFDAQKNEVSMRNMDVLLTFLTFVPLSLTFLLRTPLRKLLESQERAKLEKKIKQKLCCARADVAESEDTQEADLPASVNLPVPPPQPIQDPPTAGIILAPAPSDPPLQAAERASGSSSIAGKPSSGRTSPLAEAFGQGWSSLWQSNSRKSRNGAEASPPPPASPPPGTAVPQLPASMALPAPGRKMTVFRPGTVEFDV
jgi:hypothetical protein